ncbi:MAG TPA: hypothetical protein VL026_06015 [Rhizomicrobium sp.]|nr:hypothetical protein [Rhizomicrobium sp.]
MGPAQSYTFDRIPYTLSWRENPIFNETYAGRPDVVSVEGMFYRPEASAPKSDVVLIYMHPSGLTNHLPITSAMPKRGVPVICAASRYPRNDSALIMEKVAIDMGAHVRYAKETLGFKYVILSGWSGGGSLSLFYQSEAEDPSITHTPAGDEVNLKDAGFMPADGVIQQACHVSRALILTEWMDPSIRNEFDPDDRDASLDLFNPEIVPPYTQDFLTRYRAAQVARSKRIDAYCWDMLEKLKKNPRGEMERCFVVHGTKADPGWFDLTVDPNDRAAVDPQGKPGEVNVSPAGLGRYSSLRSWLSQWSHANSRANGPVCAARVRVPAIVIENSADDACMPSHPRRIYEGFGRTENLEKHVVKGATHFYRDQPVQLAQSVDIVIDWLRRRNFLDA